MEYYTATEAIKRLGVPASTFYHLVSEGKFARLTLPGKRQVLYRKEDVESLAEALELRQPESREQPVLKAYELV